MLPTLLFRPLTTKKCWYKVNMTHNFTGWDHVIVY